jgi:hypothetical protein
VSEFKASDPEVREIAAVFALKGWMWTVRDGLSVEPFVPRAKDVAVTLNRLYESAATLAKCFCDPSTDGECEHHTNAGSSKSGRLYVEWIDQGYGHELSFGIEWTRLP